MRSTASYAAALFSRSLGIWALLLLANSAGPAHAQLVINATIDPTFNADTMAGINAAIAQVDAVITNNLTVNITFTKVATGLGGSSTPVLNFTYANYVNALMTKQTLSANDALAIASLKYNPVVTTNNPVNANANVTLQAPLARALGLGGVVASDGTISLNQGLLAFAGSPAAGKYFTEAVAEHEIDEVLGIGGPGSALELAAAYTNQTPTTGPVGALDLYRYSAANTRSFSLDPNAAAPYFSIDGGTTKLVNFNQNGWVPLPAPGGPADFGDWGNGTAGSQSGNTPPQVQDAFGATNANYYLGQNEVTAFDIVGYNVSYTAVPEPGSLALVGAGMAAAGFARRRRLAVAVPAISG